MKITVLGSGTSHGVPVVGCNCPVCTSDDERDLRMRSSIYIEGSDGESALIDAGPEFRLQAVRAGICKLDAIFLTHSHADHIHGLDDVRPLSRNKPLPVYGNKQTIKEMKGCFSYIFGRNSRKLQRGGGRPRLNPRIIYKPVRIGSLLFTPVPVKHGVLDILGWEIAESFPAENFLSENDNAGKSFLYLTDTSAIPPSSMTQLGGGKNSRVIIIGGLRIRPHETHFTFEQALETALGLRPVSIYLTHICHSHSHAEIEGFCREFREKRLDSVREIEIHPAQDGLEITL